MNNIIVREAIIKDQHSVNDLCKRNGLEGKKSNNAWEWIWKDNMYYNNDWPLGWVLESDGKVVGFIGNIPRAYSFRGRKWIAGVARTFVVEKDFRMYTLKLIASFLQQKGADLLIFSSANSDAEAVYRLAKASSIPQKDYNKDLFWIVSPNLFFTSLLMKKGFGKLLSILFSWVASPFLYLEMLFRRRWTKYSASEIEMLSPDELTSELDELWNRLQRENQDRLLSYRDRKAIEWQFSNDSAETREPIIFTLRKGGVLSGYVIVTRADSQEFGLKRMMITDLIVCEDDPDAIRSLINEVFLYAKHNKMALLQMVGFPSAVRYAVQSLHPFMRVFSYCPFWYYAINPNLKDELQRESVWYASTFDGDSTL